MPKAVISASINLDIASQIAAEARDKGWSVSEVVNRALQAYVERQSQQPGEARPDAKTVAETEVAQMRTR